MQSRLDEAEQTLRRALALRPVRAVARRPRRRPGDAAALRGCRRKLPDRARARSAPAARPQETRPGAGGARARSRGGRRSRSLVRAGPGPAQVAEALDHLRAGRKEEAIATLRKALRENPDNVDALHTLAQAYWGDEKRVSDIEALLRRATELAPGLGAGLDAARLAAARAGSSEEAIECYRARREIDPGNASAWSGLGADYAQIGDMDKSAAAYARSLALQPGLPGIHMSHAHVLKALGRQAEALREYRAAIAQKPDFGEVYWSMANLKVFRFEPAEVAAMEEQLKREDLSPSADMHFRFALGKAYEDAGDYDRAWEYYHTGNQRQRPLVSHDPVGFEARHEEIAEVFSREFLERARGTRDSSPTPRSSSSACRAPARR